MNLISILLSILLLIGCASSTKSHPKPIGTDFHVHIHGNSTDDSEYTGKRYLLALEASNLERAVVLSHSYSRFNNPKCWSNKNCSYDRAWVRKTNEWTAEQAKAFRQLIPFCGIDISAEIDVTDEIDFCKSLGFRGIKLHSQAGRVSLTEAKVLERFVKIAKLSGERNLILLVHAGMQDPKEAALIFETARAHPRTTFVLAHILGRNHGLLAENALPNVYADISAVIIMARNQGADVAQSLRKFGIDRILFGSDWPVYHPTEALLALNSYGFTESEIRKIISENASQILP